MDHPHNREFTRVLTRMDVTIYCPGGLIASGQARDIALRGVYVEAECEMQAGSPCSIEIVLAHAPEGPKIQASGKIARVDPAGIAIEFTEIPFDSLGHLRNLVLYNSTDPDAVEHEFEQHVGLRDNYMRDPHTRAMGASLDLRAMRKDGRELAVEISLSGFRKY